MLELSEAQVKQAVEQYLQFAMNKGDLWFARLNAGQIPITNKDGSRRLFKGVEKGTSDYIVVQPRFVRMKHRVMRRVAYALPITRTIFVECKSTDGKQRLEQIVFEEKVKEIHCMYLIVRSVEELQEVIEQE